MANVDWQRVRADDFRVPAGRPLDELTAELTTQLGDPDPVVRDERALAVLTTWIRRGVYDDLLTGLGDGMAAGLQVGIGEPDTDTVFRRSCSGLVLGECIARDTAKPLVPGGKVLEWGDRIATWLLAERDLRGFVPGRGPARAVAHAADALGALSASPHAGAGELTVVLDVIGERVCRPADRVLTAGEPDRLASATMTVLRRDLVPIDIIEPWLEHLGEAAAARLRSGAADPYLDGGNADLFLRALHLQLVLSPRQPPRRADLVLLMVDALRVANPLLLGSEA